MAFGDEIVKSTGRSPTTFGQASRIVIPNRFQKNAKAFLHAINSHISYWTLYMREKMSAYREILPHLLGDSLHALYWALPSPGPRENF